MGGAGGGSWAEFYQNILVNNISLGTHTVQRKGELRKEIEEHVDVEENELEDHDTYLLEINLEELDGTLCDT